MKQLTRRQAKAKNFHNRILLLWSYEKLASWNGGIRYGIASTYNDKDDTIQVKRNAGWPHRDTITLLRTNVLVEG